MYGLPDPSHVLVQISDLHFTSRRALLHGSVDCDAHLARILEGLVTSGIRPDAIVLSGDLTDAGAPDAYERLREAIVPVAQELGSAIVWGIGNHDERAAFRHHLLPGEATNEPVNVTLDVDGLRIISLDSTIPAAHHGQVDDAQLDWLRAILATKSEHGSVLVLHHPPAPNPLPLAGLIDLQDPQRLADVVRGSDVRLILAGHVHHSLVATLAGVAVVAAPAASYGQDLLMPQPGLRGLSGGQGFNLVHVYPDQVVVSIVPVGAFAEVYSVSAADLDGLLETDDQPATS